MNGPIRSGLYRHGAGVKTRSETGLKTGYGLLLRKIVLAKIIIMKMLVTILVLLAALFYLYGIIMAVWISVKGKKNMDDYLSNIITVIGGVLATNLGAFLGINISRGTSEASLTFQSGTTGILQAAAAYFYVICLIVAVIGWFVAKSKNSTTIVSILPELAKTLMGVIVGALTVALGNNGF